MEWGFRTVGGTAKLLPHLGLTKISSSMAGGGRFALGPVCRSEQGTWGGVWGRSRGLYSQSANLRHVVEAGDEDAANVVVVEGAVKVEEEGKRLTRT